MVSSLEHDFIVLPPESWSVFAGHLSAAVFFFKSFDYFVTPPVVSEGLNNNQQHCCRVHSRRVSRWSALPLCGLDSGTVHAPQWIMELGVCFDASVNLNKSCHMRFFCVHRCKWCNIGSFVSTGECHSCWTAWCTGEVRTFTHTSACCRFTYC